MGRYLATEPVYLSSIGVYVNAGEEFVTTITPPAPCWQPLDDDARAAVEAANAPAEPVEPEPVTKGGKSST